MIITLYRYSCDGCDAAAGAGGHETEAAAWAAAKRAGWQRTEIPLDGTGHVPAIHLCRTCKLSDWQSWVLSRVGKVTPLTGPRSLVRVTSLG